MISIFQTNKNKILFILVCSCVFFVACREANDFFAEKVLICNTGIALGLEVSRTILFLMIIAVCISIFFLFQHRQNTHWIQTKTVLFGGSIFLGGALSNIVNRVQIGCVPDYFSLFFFPYFNLADVGISSGAILISISMLTDSQKK